MCEFDEKIRNIKVRGLCPETIFNSDYILTKDKNGDILYLGAVIKKYLESEEMK